MSKLRFTSPNRFSMAKAMAPWYHVWHMFAYFPAFQGSLFNDIHKIIYATSLMIILNKTFVRKHPCVGHNRIFT